MAPFLLAFVFGRITCMNITVYLGASEGNCPRILESAREFGAWIGDSGNSLVYGGSRVGLMGELALSAGKHGAYVVGIEPCFFVKQFLQLDDCADLIVTDNMQQRKALMIEKGDAFVAFPGGTGTLEEISEIISMVALKHTDVPCIIFNLDGYYNPLKEMLAKMIEAGFSTEERQDGIFWPETLDELKSILNNYSK